VETRDERLLLAFDKAVAHLSDSFASGANGVQIENPDDLSTWRWDRFLFLDTRHDLADLDPDIAAQTERFGSAGNFDTAAVANFSAFADGQLRDSLDQSNGSSVRYLFEMNPDGVEGKFQQPGGASEIPGDPHYLDLLPDYLDENYRDFPYTDAEIAETCERVIELTADGRTRAGECTMTP